MAINEDTIKTTKTKTTKPKSLNDVIAEKQAVAKYNGFRLVYYSI